MSKFVTKRKYVVTPPTRTGFGIYLCDVEYRTRTRYVYFKGAKYLGGGGVVTRSIFTYPYCLRVHEQIFDTEAEALACYIRASTPTYRKPLPRLRQAALDTNLAAAKSRLAELPPPPVVVDTILQLTSDQLVGSMQCVDVKTTDSSDACP